MRCKGFYHSKTFDTKVNALSWALELEQSLLDESGIIQGKTMLDALDRYEAEVSKGRKGERWDRVRINKHRRAPLADVMLEQLTTENMNHWIVEQTTSAATINRDWKLLSSIFTHCVKWQWMRANPCKECNRPKSPPPRERRISKTEIDRILKALYFAEDEGLTVRKQTGYAFLIALEISHASGRAMGAGLVGC